MLQETAARGNQGSWARPWSAVLGLLIVVALLLPAGPAAAVSSDTSSDAATALAEKHAPIVVVREQAEECGDGEPFRPTPVTTVLGKPDVVLRGPDGEVITAPTAADIAGKGDGWYLDYPGNPLAPGCDYEKWFRTASAGTQPTLYAHVATDPDHPDKLALQYWFFYTFNDWNDKHEGDWEMVQVVFPASTPEDALKTTPESVAYAQHEGSQVSEWDSSGLIKVGDRPVVYPGQGSHAAYYLQRNWFGKSAAAGFGCDNTTPPGSEVQPQIVVLPSGTPPTTGEFAWVSYTGHWGQQEPSFNNGPTGPVTKTQWATPITWQIEEGRTSAVSLPPAPGPALTAFCSVTASGSLLFVKVLDRPWLVIGLVLAVLLLIIVLVRRTAWRHARSDEPDLSRRAGQIVTGSFGWVRRHLPAVIGISAVIFLSALLSRVLQTVLTPAPDAGDITGASATYGTASVVILLVAVVLVILVLGGVAASVIALVRDDAEHRPPSAATALRAGFHERSAVVAAIAVVGATLLMAGSVVLLPLAAWFVSAFAVAAAAAVVEDLPLGVAFRRSAQLTKGRRWRTLLVQTMLLAVGLFLAGLVGAVLLLVTSWPFWVTGLITSILAALLLPVAFAGTAMQFYDLRRRSGEAAAEAAVDPVSAG